MKKEPLKVRIVHRLPPEHPEPRIRITTKAGMVIVKHFGLKQGVKYTAKEARWIWSQHDDVVKKNMLLAYLWDKVIELIRFIIKLRYE